MYNDLPKKINDIIIYGLVARVYMSCVHPSSVLPEEVGTGHMSCQRNSQAHRKLMVIFQFHSVKGFGSSVMTQSSL